MSLFAQTRGKAILSPAICDRCRLRGASADMVEDGDKPGLFVHKHCSDEIDPWKLPPRMAEEISIAHPRPDADVSTADVGLLTNHYDSRVLTDNLGRVLLP